MGYRWLLIASLAFMALIQTCSGLQQQGKKIHLFVRSNENDNRVRTGTLLDPFASIQEAIYAAPKVDGFYTQVLIHVMKGVYSEDLIVDRNVTVIGCESDHPVSERDCPNQTTQEAPRGPRNAFIKADSIIVTIPNAYVGFHLMSLSFKNMTVTRSIHSFSIASSQLLCGIESCNIALQEHVLGTFRMTSTMIDGRVSVKDYDCFSKQIEKNSTYYFAKLVGKIHISYLFMPPTVLSTNSSRGLYAAPRFSPSLDLNFRTVQIVFLRQLELNSVTVGVHRPDSPYHQPLLAFRGSAVGPQTVYGPPPSVVLFACNLALQENTFDNAILTVSPPGYDNDIASHTCSWTWNITKNLFANSTVRLRSSMTPIVNGSMPKITVSYNRFQVSQSQAWYSTPNHAEDVHREVLILDSNSLPGLFVDARHNWFSCENGPGSCCNLNPVAGLGVSFGVDFSQWCTVPDCSLLSRSDVAAACAHQRRCTAFEEYLWAIPIAINAAILLSAIIVGRLVYLKSHDPEKQNRWVITAIFSAVIAISITGMVVIILFMTKYICNNRVMCANQTVARLFFAFFLFIFACGLVCAIWALVIVKRDFRSLRWLFIMILLTLGVGIIVVPTGMVSSHAALDWNDSNDDLGNGTYIAAPKIAMPREIWYGFGATIPLSLMLLVGAIYTWRLVVWMYMPDVASAQSELETLVRRVGVQERYGTSRLIARPSYRLAMGMGAHFVASVTYLALVIVLMSQVSDPPTSKDRDLPDENIFDSSVMIELTSVGFPFRIFSALSSHMTMSILFLTASLFGIIVLRLSFWRPALLYAYSVVSVAIIVAYALPLSLTVSLMHDTITMAHAPPENQICDPQVCYAAATMASHFGWNGVAVMAAGIAATIIQFVMAVSVSHLRSFTSKKLPVVIASNIDQSMSQLLEGD